MSKTQGKHVVSVVVDALMAIAFVLVMATALVEEAPHEYLGLALFALIIAHVVLHRRWFAALGRGHWSALRALQVGVLLGLAICITGQVVSAVVLSKHALSFLPAISGSALARSVHLICSYWAFVLAFAHSGLQAKNVLRRIGGIALTNRALLCAFRVVVAAVSIFGAVSVAQLGLLAYLAGKAQFAAGDPNVLFACVRWASVAVLVSAVFHCLRSALESSR